LWSVVGASTKAPKLRKIRETGEKCVVYKMSWSIEVKKWRRRNGQGK